MLTPEQLMRLREVLAVAVEEQTKDKECRELILGGVYRGKNHKLYDQMASSAAALADIDAEIELLKGAL